MLKFLEYSYAKGLFNGTTGQTAKIKFFVESDKMYSIMVDQMDTVRGRVTSKNDTFNSLKETFVIQDINSVLSYLKQVKNPTVSLEYNSSHGEKLPIYLVVSDNEEKAKFVLAKHSIVKDVKFPTKIDVDRTYVVDPTQLKDVFKKGAISKSEFTYLMFSQGRLDIVFTKDIKKFNNSVKLALLKDDAINFELVLKYDSKSFKSLFELFDKPFNLGLTSPHNLLYLNSVNGDTTIEYILSGKK